DVTHKLHALAPDQVSRPALEIGVLGRHRLGLAVVPLDDAGTMTELDVTQGVFDDRVRVGRAGDVEAGEATEYLGIRAVVHNDLVFERFVFHGPNCSQGAGAGERALSPLASTSTTGTPAARAEEEAAMSLAGKRILVYGKPGLHLLPARLQDAR